LFEVCKICGVKDGGKATQDRTQKGGVGTPGMQDMQPSEKDRIVLEGLQ
jgi:hypothetical protein